MFGEDTTFKTSIEDRYGYMWIEFGDFEITLGFGDTEPNMWNGVVYWQLNTLDGQGLYEGEINNGSPSFILWELFSAIASNLTTNN